jgi:hypothetical protein
MNFANGPRNFDSNITEVYSFTWTLFCLYIINEIKEKLFLAPFNVIRFVTTDSYQYGMKNFKDGMSKIYESDIKWQ